MHFDHIPLKLSKKLTFLLLIVILFIIFKISCSKSLEYIKESLYNPEEYLTIWAHSDIQPRNLSERKYYEIAISDISSNFSIVDVALVAGDIVNWSKSEEDYEWYLEKKSNAPVRYWYEIAGNHDQKDGQNTYIKHIKKPLHYSVHIGNMLILCMSDEEKTPETEISNNAFNWWKEMVTGNQDKIIITMTHGYLKQSGLLGTMISSRNIRDSGRFANVLKNYKVDIWLNGHTHLSHLLNGNVKVADKLNGTIFINVSAIRGGTYNNVQSFLLFFKKNSNEAVIKSRDHEKKTYDKDDILFKLSHEFKWDNSPPVMKKMENTKTGKTGTP